LVQQQLPPTEAGIDRSIRTENLILLGKRLAETTDIVKRQQILVLLDEEKAKGHLPTEKEAASVGGLFSFP
jgi:ABC-type lipoprotein release transport system permease subunit